MLATDLSRSTWSLSYLFVEKHLVFVIVAMLKTRKQGEISAGALTDLCWFLLSLAALEFRSPCSWKQTDGRRLIRLSQLLNRGTYQYQVQTNFSVQIIETSRVWIR